MYSQHTEWVVHAAGKSHVSIADVIVDNAGNHYATGHFDDTLVYKSFSGQDTLIDGGFGDAFVVKQDACGRLVWIRHFRGTSSVSPDAVAIDSRGRVITAGEFASTTDFDPGTGTHLLDPNGGNAIYVSVLDENGDFVRVGRIGGSPGMYVPDVAVDDSDNLYISGSFSGGFGNDPVNISPDPAIRHELTPQGTVDGFIVKVDADGNFLFAKHFKSSNTVWVNAIATGGGQVYATGSFHANADFEPGTGDHVLGGRASTDGFIVQLSNNDEVERVHHIRGVHPQVGLEIEVDALGFAYTAGNFISDLKAGEGSNTVSVDAGSGYSSYIARWAPDGELQWLRHFRSASSITDLAFNEDAMVLADRPIYVTGYFRGTADFAPDSGGHQLAASPGQSNYFIAKLRRDGRFEKVSRLAVANRNYGARLALDNDGNLFMSGSFEDTATFNKDTDQEIQLIAVAKVDGFIRKISEFRERTLSLGPDTTLCGIQGIRQGHLPLRKQEFTA